MPGKIWTKMDDGELRPRFISRGQPTGRPSDLTSADDLDRAIDGVLDEAEHLHSQLSHPDVRGSFTRAWAVGRAIRQSGVLQHPALKEEESDFLWEVMAAKARVAVRSDGTPEESWTDLRPSFGKERTAREGSRKGDDYWSMCVWLAEQDYGAALRTFAGSIRNVWQMLDRPTLRPLVLRRALNAWLEHLPPDQAKHLTSTRTFPELMKQFVRRWPSKGRRSAMQPIHYDEHELRAEIERLVSAQGVVEGRTPS